LNFGSGWVFALRQRRPYKSRPGLSPVVHPANQILLSWPMDVRVGEEF
jgi:hypothetical protein